MNPQQKLALLGAVTLILSQRSKLDQLEEGAARLLEEFGGKIANPRHAYDTVLSLVQDWVIEDRPAEEIVEKIIGGLEFGEEAQG